MYTEMLDDAFSSIKSASQRAASINSVRGVVEGIVTEAATLTWEKCVETVIRTREPLRLSISNNMPILLDTEERLNAQLTSLSKPVMEPIVNDLIADTIMPFVGTIYDHIVGAHSAAISGLCEAMCAWIMR